MKEAKTLQHPLAHLPKNKFCPLFIDGRMVKNKCRSQDSDCQDIPFGTNATSDHMLPGRTALATKAPRLP